LSTYFFTHFTTQILGTLGAGLSTFPWLSASILFPIGSAFVIPFFPDKGDGKEVRWFALSIALITFLIPLGSLKQNLLNFRSFLQYVISTL